MSEAGIPRAVSLVGKQLDRYQLEAELGSGGFGAVYIARHAVLGTEVAVKVLWPSHARSPEIVERFHREARAAASIGHPHIIRVHDAGTSHDGWPFLAMELLKGRDLEAELEQRGRLDLHSTVEIGLQVLDALAAAHQSGIIHRDLKPANVFLAEGPDGRPFVKLLDFGVSKMEGTGPSLTQTGTMLGTPHYMAPEQLESSRLLDGRADLFAIGVMLYRMLAGRLPLDGEGYGVLLQRIQGVVAPPLRSFAPEVPAAVDQVIAKAMSFEATDRFADAAAMADALLSASGEEPSTSTAQATGLDVPSAAVRGLAAMNVATAPPASALIPATLAPRGGGTALLAAPEGPNTGPAQAPHPWLLASAASPASPAPASVAVPVAAESGSLSTIGWIAAGALGILCALCIGAAAVLGIRLWRAEDHPSPAVRAPTPAPAPVPVVRPPPIAPIAPIAPTPPPAPIPPPAPANAAGVEYRIAEYTGMGARSEIDRVLERVRADVADCGTVGRAQDVSVMFIATIGGAITISQPADDRASTDMGVARCVADAIPAGGPARFAGMQTAIVTVDVHVPAR